MALPQLTDEQMERVQEFFTSDEAALLWQRLEGQIMADWLIAESTEERERNWHEMQAVLALQAALRDAKANKQLDLRLRSVKRTDPV